MVRKGGVAGLSRDGTGTRKNLRRALKWYEKAAAQGNGEAADAAEILREIFADRKAFSRDLPLAEGGDVAAMKRVAHACEWGEGTKKSAKRAKMWYLRAAEAGDAEAQYRAGSLLLFAKRADYDGALRWFERAAAQGYEGAEEEAAFIKKMRDLPEG